MNIDGSKYNTVSFSRDKDGNQVVTPSYVEREPFKFEPVGPATWYAHAGGKTYKIEDGVAKEMPGVQEDGKFYFAGTFHSSDGGTSAMWSSTTREEQAALPGYDEANWSEYEMSEDRIHMYYDPLGLFKEQA